jgi:predicted ATPase
MKIIGVNLVGHPGVGNVAIPFSDELSAPQVVILAGGNGCGKTAILEAIQKTFESDGTVLNIGVIELDLLLSNAEIERINSLPEISKIDRDAKKFRLTYDSSSEAAQRSWSGMFKLTWVDKDDVIHDAPTPVWPIEAWSGFLMTFFSEANVSFDAPPLHSIGSGDVDSPNKKGKRSGSKLANEIAQLIVDIRAADNEDLANWVAQNLEQPVPLSVRDRRFSRFVRAFEYMFPNKRFKEVSRSGGLLSPQFVEHGRVSSLDNLSTGEKQIVFRAGFFLRDLAALGSSVVLIDEPELSLHPEWQSRVVGFYKHLLTDADGNCPQIVIATHSPFIVHGAGNSKIVILEKDNVTGAIRPMLEPAYPSVAASEAVRAFNVDAFLSDATATQLLVLTEGETDKLIIETAWSKLHPGQPKPFELRAALGARNINITLNDDQVIRKMNGRKVVGVFDFDDAYNHWHGVWKHGHSLFYDESKGLVKKHTTAPLWSMLLPVPDFRLGFASQDLKGNSILSIEFMFDDSDHIPGLIQQKQMAVGQRLPEIVEGKKGAFAAHVENLSADRFAAFEPLFDRFSEMINRVI